MPSVAQIQFAHETVDTVHAAQKLKSANGVQGLSYPLYYPHFDVGEKFPHLERFDHVDPGSRADPKKPNLLNANVTTHHISPYLGTEVSGVQISQLTKEGLDELALFTAERKVLIFRDQDFKDVGLDRQVELAKHFGPLQIHIRSGNVKGYPEFHIVYRDAAHDRYKGEYYNRVNKLGWHSDGSFEKQPPGTTFFVILEQPEVGGGDTLFLSQVEAYNRLSPEFKKRLEGLRAVHSAVDLAKISLKNNGPFRRESLESLENEHPLVRVHPVTGEKALFVTPGYTRRIIGYKVEESEQLLKFLFDHISKGADFQIRLQYKPGTVVVWDNRVHQENMEKT